ncbi:MAG: nucleotidyl transferase AbiEii/AbiGii toxin family protein [Candidatus Rokuibacteriota bacterium]
MTRLQEVLFHLAADLGALRCDWALLGALALAVRVAPRETTDVDVGIAVADDREADRVVFGLHSRGYRDLPEGVLEDRVTGRLSTMRLVSPTDEATGVDLLFDSSGIEPEIVAAAERIEIVEGLVVPVVQTGHLLALKVFAGRPKDLGDIPAILGAADPTEIDRARHALELISRRPGRDRGRDLVEELEALLQQPREFH